jgi:hypothetical protein
MGGSCASASAASAGYESNSRAGPCVWVGASRASPATPPRACVRGGVLPNRPASPRFAPRSPAVGEIYYYAPLNGSEVMAEWVCEVHAPVCLCALYFPVGPQLVPKGA